MPTKKIKSEVLQVLKKSNVKYQLLGSHLLIKEVAIHIKEAESRIRFWHVSNAAIWYEIQYNGYMELFNKLNLFMSFSRLKTLDISLN